MGKWLLARAHVQRSINQNIVAPALSINQKHAHPQIILRSSRTNALKLIATLMMIKLAPLLASMHLTTLLLFALEFMERNYAFLLSIIIREQ
jgi:hypothetical protein